MALGFPARGVIIGVAMGVAAAGAAAQGIDPADRMLATAEGLYARGQHDLARGEFAAFLKAFPTHARAVQARYGRGLASYQLNDLPAAATDLQAVVADKTFARRDEALAVLATAYLAAGDAERALAATDLLLKDHPASTQVEGTMVNRAQALFRLGRFDEARAEAAAMVRVYPKSAHRPTAVYVAALAQRAMGNDADAERLAREITETYPNAPYVWEAQVMIGETLAGRGKVDEAVKHFEAIRQITPEGKKAAVEFGLGMALARGGRFEAARRTFAGIAERFKDSPLLGQAKLQGAVTLVKLNQRDEARTELAKVAQSWPELSASSVYWTARCDISDGKLENARALLERLVAAKPAPAEIAEAVFDLAYCELGLGQDAAAVKRLDGWRAAYPYSQHMPEALFYQASALHRLGEFERSQKFCEAALKYAAPTVVRPAEILRGENMLMQKKYAEADAAFAKLETGAAGAEALRIAVRRGQCAYYAGDFKGAEERLSAADRTDVAAADPLRLEGLFLRGDARLQLGKHAEAAKTFQSYIKLSKGRGDEAHFKLAVAQIGARDRAAGAQTLAELIKGDVKSEWVQRAWFEWGQLAYEERRYDDAGKAMATVLAAGPQEAIAVPAGYVAARVEIETGKAAAAAARLAELLKAYPKHALAEDVLFSRGLALKNAGDAKEAVKQFEAYVAAYPRGKYVTDAWHQGAAALTASGKAGDAAKILGQLAAEKTTRTDSVLYDLAWAQRSGGDAKAAGETYKALLAEFAASTRANAARVELADLSAQAGDLDGAVDLLNAALKDPAIDRRSRAVAVYRLGAAHLRRDEPTKAAAAFDRFAQENPDDPLVASALCEAGAAYARAQQFDAAVGRLKQVIADYAKTDAAKLAMVRMGDVQNQLQQYDAAAETLEKWLKANPGDPLTALAEFGVGWSLEGRGHFGPARERYARVVGLDKGSTGARAQFQIGETYFKEKKFDVAAKELLTVDILYNSPEWAAPALYEAGCAFEALGDVKRARGQWEECVKKYPRSAVAGMAQKKLDAARP